MLEGSDHSEYCSEPSFLGLNTHVLGPLSVCQVLQPNHCGGPLLDHLQFFVLLDMGNFTLCCLGDGCFLG